MHIGGIIAEYDPFHNGHKAHIEAMRQNGVTHVVAVMNGNFTQRGEPSAFTKWQRTAMALAGGVDLVIELPLPYGLANAETFARGGVSLLKALGCVQTLSFGSECGNATALQTLAEHLDSPAFADAFDTCIRSGVPYAFARQQAVATLYGENEAQLLSKPNNILGAEYIRAINAVGAGFGVHTVLRAEADHDSPVPGKHIAGASYIRKAMRNNNEENGLLYVPTTSKAIIETALREGHAPTDCRKDEAVILATLRKMTADDFAGLPFVSEGLENRLFRVSRCAGTVEELLTNLKTKRYPMARLKRILYSAVLGVSKDDSALPPPYLRILGMNERGREILATASPTLPVISRSKDAGRLDIRGKRLLALEENASDYHALLLPVPYPCGTDFSTRVLTVE